MKPRVLGIDWGKTVFRLRVVGLDSSILTARLDTDCRAGSVGAHAAGRQTMNPKAGPNIDAETLTASDAVTVAAGPTLQNKPANNDVFLTPGAVLAKRYEIVQLLGEGGMGAVYKARDRELERVVALKIIRPDLVGHEWMLQRFKQELILARQITHRNVIRIYDLGEDAGIKFITMEYIEGETLKTILKNEGKLPPIKAGGIIRQVCQGLAAAHAEGVIHRDLKPGNIMRDHQGRIVVMDFGVAHSMEAPQAISARGPGNGPSLSNPSIYHSQPGALVGTPAYMAPEQASSKEADGRCDIFALGVILFELLTGQLPHEAATRAETLRKGTREKPKTLAELDAKVPRSLSKIVERCLQPEPDARYQTATEVLADLDQYLAPFVRKAWKWMAAAAVLLLVGTEFVVQQRVTHRATPQHAPMSVLVADFKNQTGDPIFDTTLEPALGGALEGASFVNAYNRGQALKIAEQLRPGAASLDETLARLVAEREGINVIVAGAITRLGNRYNIECKAIDAVSGNTIIDSNSTAANKDGVLRATNTLAARVRAALGDATPLSVQMAQAETFTSSSLPAAHQYATAMDLQWAGKYEEAIQAFKRTIEMDPNMGRAYVGIAAILGNRGSQAESMQNYKLALEKIDSMSEREKYRTRGAYYLHAREPEKAEEELSKLVQLFPADSAGAANLAFAYFFLRDMPKALEEGRRAVEISPKNVPQRNNLGLYAMYAGDFATAIKEQQTVMELNPKFERAYVGMALSQLAQGQSAQAKETYSRLAGVSSLGASLSAAGLADIALLEGRANDAAPILAKSVAADLENKSTESAARGLTTLAEAYLLQEKRTQALAAADKAIGTSAVDEVKFLAAQIYLAAGMQFKALPLADQLSNSIETDSQAYAKIIEGQVVLEQGKIQDALRFFDDAKKIADTWWGRYTMARAYIALGAYPEADSELEVCLTRRGEATALFLDELPTYHLLPPVYYYLGRAQEGLKSPAAKESYQTFLNMQPKGTSPLLADARRRVGSQ